MEETIKKSRGRPKGSLNKATLEKQAQYEQEIIEKATSNDVPTSRLRLGDIGYLGLKNISNYINEEMKQDLKYPFSLTTYDMMHMHPTIWTALELQKTFIEKAFASYNISSNKDNPKSVKAAKFLKYCFENMQSTIRTVITEAQTAEKYGFSVMVKNYKNNPNTKEFPEYRYSIADISPRSQKSLDPVRPFRMDENRRQVIGCLQSKRYLTATADIYMDKATTDDMLPSDFFIPRNKFMLFTPNATNGNPFG